MDSSGIKKENICLQVGRNKALPQSRSAWAVSSSLDLQPESSKKCLLNDDVWKQIWKWQPVLTCLKVPLIIPENNNINSNKNESVETLNVRKTIAKVPLSFRLR